MNRLFIILIIIFMLLLTACTNEDIYIDDVKDETPLSIYLFRRPGFVEIVRNYNRIGARDGREIDYTLFTINSEEDIEAMYTQILNEISLGGGPDIILIDRRTDRYIDINKISQSNAFADMDILIEKSETFNFDDYNKMALDAGVLNDKRVFMPMSYHVEYQLGIEENFDYYNLDIPEEMTMDAYLDLIEEYYKVSDNEATLWAEPVYLLAEFIKIGEPIEKTKQLERLFELLKIENERCVELSNVWYSGGPKYFDNYDPFVDNEYLLVIPKRGINQYRLIYENFNYINSEKQLNMILFEQPINENSAVRAFTERGLAININSKHKNEAFEFVEYALTHSTQSSIYSIYELPVNKVTYNDEVKKFLDINGYDNLMEYLCQIKDINIPTEMKKDFVEYIESAQTCEYMGSFRYVYLNIMSQSIDDYYNDRLTYDELIDELNNKLTIYYTE